MNDNNIENNINNDNLIQIENQLKELLNNDKRRWVDMYNLLDEVETNKLYEGNYRSFSAWINHIALELHIHVSLIWRRKKAGAYYNRLNNALKQRDNKELKPLEDTVLTSSSINYIQKICNDDIDKAIDLVEKIDSNQMKVSELKNAWHTIRADKVLPKNAHERDKMHDNKDIDDKEHQKSICAADIVLALQNDNQWFGSAIEKHGMKLKKRFYTELGINTGSSKHVRRFDGVLIENYTTQYASDGLRIHGIEIKVSKSDLMNDTKMAEYTDFCDFFYLATPSYLENDALDYIDNRWGLLIVHDDGTIEVVREPNMNMGLLRHETIEKALYKSM